MTPADHIRGLVININIKFKRNNTHRKSELKKLRTYVKNAELYKGKRRKLYMIIDEALR